MGLDVISSLFTDRHQLQKPLSQIFVSPGNSLEHVSL